ncbi:MAG: DUF4446 family protein [Alicyclobacillaceae bacterium]|nr:DUF4446 family protein [Alicyclobacillaceae bacterium]
MPQLTSPRILELILGVVLLLSLMGCVFGLTGFTSAARTGRRFRRWKSVNASADLEQVYQQTIARVQVLAEELAQVRQELDRIRTTLQSKVSTPEVLRFNAFPEMGSDLSFSLALLDDRGDGVVLSSIYGREESRVFAKPVRGGQSDYPLTDEEIYVIQGASQPPEGETVRSRARPVQM